MVGDIGGAVAASVQGPRLDRGPRRSIVHRVGKCLTAHSGQSERSISPERVRPRVQEDQTSQRPASRDSSVPKRRKGEMGRRRSNDAGEEACAGKPAGQNCEEISLHPSATARSRRRPRGERVRYLHFGSLPLCCRSMIPAPPLAARQLHATKCGVIEIISLNVAFVKIC